MYPPGTEYLSSYIESRGGIFPSTMFVGLQAFLREYLTTPITVDNIDDAEFLSREQGVPFNRNGWIEDRRESTLADTWNAMRVGMFALMRPVMTSTDGRCVAKIK